MTDLSPTASTNSDDPGDPGDPSSPRTRWPRLRRRLVRVAIGSLLLVAVAALIGGLAGVFVLPPPSPGTIDLDARIAALPRDGLDLFAPVEIRFDEHQIPFVFAQDPRDVPYALGLLHAHLRAGQMELIRHLSQGRLSELVGPFGRGIDRAVRALDLDRAVPAIVDGLPPETRAWLDRFVAGVNAHVERARPPFELRRLARRAEPWTVEDVLTFGRLLSVDINWLRWFRLLPLRDEPHYDELMARLGAFAAEGRSSFGPTVPLELGPLHGVGAGRPGSNGFVVAPSRSASGGALVAADPHLGIQFPNAFLLAGFRAPGMAAVGMMYPGVPFVLIGRNEHGAWCGTNMQGLSSTLYDASGFDDEDFEIREETVATRFFGSTTFRYRESPVGPVVSDVPQLASLSDRPLALRWRGHEPSDEATAMFEVQRSTDWESFRAAFATYAVSGQNLLYASADGHIGQLPAIEYRPTAGAVGDRVPADPTDPAHAWGEGVPCLELPFALDPPSGYLISCNNTPVLLDPPLTAGGNSNDRVARIAARIEADEDGLTLDELVEIQRDVRSPASEAAARALADALADAEADAGADAGADVTDVTDVTDASKGHERGVATLRREIEAWDGRYAVDSVGATAYQGLLEALLVTAYVDRYGEAIANYLRSSPAVHDFVRQDLESGELTAPAVARAARLALSRDEPKTAWGDVHRLRLAHPAAAAPVVGGWFRFGDRPVSGSTTTVRKSAHAVSAARHATTFGACARFVADLADPDANRFVLLGGQDGWLGSAHFLDQVEPFLEGRTIAVPLTDETVRSAFGYSVVLRPKAGGHD